MVEIKRFNSDVIASESMQSEIKAIGNDLEKLVAYANGKGYQFSLEDVKGATGEAELSEDQLDDVSGGVVLISGVADAGLKGILVF